MPMSVSDLARLAKNQIAEADKADATAKQNEKSAEQNRIARDRKFESAGKTLIRLHAECEAKKESFSKILKDKVGISRARAYELIGNAGGIPGKVKAQSVEDSRERAREGMNRSRELSVTRNVTDNVHQLEPRKGTGCNYDPEVGSEDDTPKELRWNASQWAIEEALRLCRDFKLKNGPNEEITSKLVDQVSNVASTWTALSNQLKQRLRKRA